MKLNSGRLWLRIATYGSLAVVLLLVLIRALIYWQFDEAAVRGALTHALNDTGRAVHIDGRITPSVFPYPGIDIEKVSISEPGKPAVFARVELLRVSLAWMPLLFGNREIKAVELYGPSASITRGLDGQLNISDLFQRRSPGAYSIKLDQLRIREGTLLLSDQPTHTDKRLSSISLDADDLRSTASVSAGAILDDDKRPVRLALNTPLAIQDDQVSLPQLEAVAISNIQGLGETKLSVTGQYKLNFASLQATGSDVTVSFSSDRPSSEVKLALPQINASLHELAMPSGSLSAKLIYARSQYQLQAQLENLKLSEGGLYADKLDGEFNWLAGSTKVNVKLNAPFSLAGMNQLLMQPLKLTSTIATPALPRGKLVTSMEGSLDGDIDEPRFNLRVAGKLDGSDVSATLSQYGLIKPRHEATLTIGKLDLNRYLPESQGDPVAIFQNTNEIPLDWLDFFDLNGKVAIGELAMGRFRINHISSNVRINPRALELDQMSADIYDGRLQGDASLSRRDVPRLQVKQTLQGMKIRPLLVDLFNFGRLDGKGNGKIDISADGKSFADLRNTLSGDAAFSLNNGALTGIDLVAALKNLPAELKEWNSAAQNDQKTTFSTLSTSFKLDKGIARNQDLKLASQLVNVNGGGKIDLKQSIVDYTMDVQANPQEFAQLKGVNVPLKITGPINAPVYALDFNAMVKGKKTEGEKKQALKQQLQKQITTILP
ncbi:AsmA family protein [Chromobacterium subtsugae]|uniref:AsmA family protein n=1 Tax=Chromobacterium subtsugae TaxID=251747 RepID=A0ABS7FCM6_9NEIS|nr:MULTISPECIES: AsmA family protein [Chromobacterium]KUM05674.1 cell envelope biogenesis protein AsmA [Chromobacterium subtsugae]KZE87159.1 cell envelope biogenesis protein AsmA [Chromobacterium sp. F49]MBW7565896.1 AsmA family protein [Chromobacterium subtsugae]MBW8287064.1 AsmA family protein [Chromobacterium subtsugae]OBU88170.1 cell envelope biogenesis protein AsmA [Chromobacterium subtsugae]